jgi:hypothetical protein
VTVSGRSGATTQCRYDVFHDKMIIEKHECGLTDNDELENVGLKLDSLPFNGSASMP